MRVTAIVSVLFPTILLAQTERYSVPGQDVAIYNLAGQLTAVAGTGGDVTVQVTRVGADAAKLTVQNGVARGRQSLRVIYPDTRIVYAPLGRHSSTTLDVEDDGTFGGDGRGHRVRITGDGSGLEAAADLKVAIPAGKKVRFYWGVGRVSITNVDGDLRVEAAGADVTTENTKGALSLDTGSGTVRITKAEGPVDLDSGSGDVTISGVRGPSLNIDSGSGDVRADDVAVDRLDLDSGSGTVTLAGARVKRMKIDSGSGGVDLGLLGDIDDLDLDSGSGRVTIRIPDGLGAQLDVDAGSGGVRTDMPIQVTRYESDRLVGTIGDGKGRIHIDSGSGEVRLVRNP